jgi:hypothetical protein
LEADSTTKPTIRNAKIRLTRQDQHPACNERGMIAIA